MSSLFAHNESSVFPFTKVYKLKNKNRDGHKKVTLNVRQIKSPDARSVSLRKKSASKLFKQAHKVPSLSTQQTITGFHSENDFSEQNQEEQEGEVFKSKTRRAQTFELIRKKITLKKQLSQDNDTQNNVEVCINNQKVLNTKQEDLINSLTRLILDEGNQTKQTVQHGLDQILGEDTLDQHSFELQIDSNLIQGNKELMEWSDLMKRI